MLILHGKVNVGHSNLLGREDDGTHVTQRVVAPGLRAASPTIDLDAFVGVGNLEVSRG